MLLLFCAAVLIMPLFGRILTMSCSRIRMRCLIFRPRLHRMLRRPWGNRTALLLPRLRPRGLALAKWIWITIWRWWIFTNTRITRPTKSLNRCWPALKRRPPTCRGFLRHGRRFRGCIPTTVFTYTRKLIRRRTVPKLWLLHKKGLIPIPKTLWHINIWLSPSSMMVTVKGFERRRERHYD